MLRVTDIKYLKNEEMEYVIDPLTQIINRKFIIKIANGLIADNIPFSLMILDLDNFKQINDSYGHLAGDFILKSIGEALIKFYGQEIYIGRYGGDEILLLLPNLHTYDDVHNFLSNLYTKDKVLRKYYNDGTRDIYLTATLGAASYPTDAKNFEDLFAKADKALYRGKTKGRNCYIIYVEEKHKDIVVREKSEGSLIEHFKSAVRVFDIYRDNKYIKHMMDFLYSELHCSGAYFLTKNEEIISFKDERAIKTEKEFKPHVENLLRGDNTFYQTPLVKYKENDPELRDFLESRAIQSVLIVKLDTFNEFYGYILLCEKQITRVWQESEIALVMYAASLLELKLKKDNY